MGKSEKKRLSYAKWQIKKGFLLPLTLLQLKRLRQVYWNFRAQDIYERWGFNNNDFDVVKEIIILINPHRLLDIGCGNGRLFPLYQSLGIREVVAQDIASKAIFLCKKRFPVLSNIRFEKKEITELDYPENYFELTISSLVLSAISPVEIEKVFDHLVKISRYIYLRETTEGDYSLISATYWYKHNYGLLAKRTNLKIIKQGVVDNQVWMLFGK